MILNTEPADRSSLKVMILSCPKTGNTWLRWLVRYAYRLPVADLPQEWSDDVARSLPERFITHQHLQPTEALVRWIVDNRVAVLTTVRHPADTLLSYFHFGKWQDLSADPNAAEMAQDGERPGKRTMKFLKYSLPREYAISLAWARLGAHVVRYEDLLRDPVSELRRVTSRIAPVEEYEIKAAALLCKPEQMTRPGLVDPRHIRSARERGWVDELPDEIVEAMAGMEPFRSACASYGYDWDRSVPEVPAFDYDAIDPFRGIDYFDNGEPVGPSLARIYLHEAERASSRWPDPRRTGGDSFWNWLIAPSEEAASNCEEPPETLTNLMVAVWRMRPDVQAVYPDPVGRDRSRFLAWFLGQAPAEFRFPWGLIAPVMDAYCDHLARMRPAPS